jgi:hypothetical protein
MTGQEVSAGELNIVSGVRGGDGQHVGLDVRNQVMGFKQWQRKGMKPEEPQQGVPRCHGNVYQDVSVSAVKQERGLDLEEVGVIFDQQVTAGLAGLFLQLLIEQGKFCGIKVIHSEPLMNGGLDGVGHPSEAIA